ncbi:PREDICTED: G-protein coupled receptor Mth2-like [Vollenhovia emeryi]|uniref:G-protein coupled receptor Mth2-like n=1 Tax=Vollenhovia emeryi TaxID=411798 RepID=UPI0005F36003|nr:PREDICTED: G-protein coupled receptor Mth2-like [Vollenhovia emeryi]XP_011863583.1 PREDICTED: G-protein coupled receptor Mth2-like [Vollenhovia emeryi]
MGLIRVCVLFASLLTPIACTSDVVPTIYPIPWQNETVVPEEYRQLPLVGKCCSIGEVIVKDTDGGTVCVSSNDTTVYFSPFFSDFNRTGALVPGDEYKTFVAIVGNPCSLKYMLHPEESSEDEYYLLMNGSIFAPRIDHVPIMLMPGKDYCMEVVPEMGLRALVCFQDIAAPTADARVIIYACGLLISVPFLILTIAAYVITPRLRDVHGKALCHYCGCLALAFTTLALTQLASAQLSPQACVSIAFVIQFSFVACFFWLNVMCIETWLLVRHHVNQRAYRRIQPQLLFFYYSIWAWGFPAALILVSMAMDLSPTIPMTYVKPAFGSESCWFKSDVEALPYFYVPVGLLLLVNMILFIITAVRISRYQQELALRRLARNQHSDRADQRLFRRLKRIFIVCLVLFFLMGLNWMMELISWGVGGDPFDWTAFDLVNALQGVLVFGLFVLRRPIRDIVWHRIQKIRGIDTMEVDVGSMDLALLPVINGDIAFNRSDRSFNNS